ncbi:hypothetical protein CC80DRAFT_269939 [Byssothecium circinans]|uniref:ATPase AAA-type core domain-containing protein n=1 Tax=Byssothecium circinans TaxID=147558 RepID=A0A6A5UIY5_9PLEO|nr:hypothetical protein CC80DRAFT_269939 [Byssothecium circinans]
MLMVKEVYSNCITVRTQRKWRLDTLDRDPFLKHDLLPDLQKFSLSKDEEQFTWTPTSPIVEGTFSTVRRAQTVNDQLHELPNKCVTQFEDVDGFKGHLLIFSTNAPHSLDQTLYRPGRIDRKFFLGHATKITAACASSASLGEPA